MLELSENQNWVIPLFNLNRIPWFNFVKLLTIQGFYLLSIKSILHLN